MSDFSGDIELFDNGESLHTLLFFSRNHDTRTIASENSSQKDALGLLREQHMAEGASMQEQEPQHIPPDPVHTLGIVKEVELVNILQGSGFNMELEEVLPFLFIQILLF